MSKTELRLEDKSDLRGEKKNQRATGNCWQVKPVAGSCNKLDMVLVK